MLQDLIGTILENILGFLFVYVQTHAEEFWARIPSIRSLVFDQTSSGGIDQDHPVFHLGNGVLVDQMIGAVHQRAVEGDQIALGQELIQADIGDKIQRRILIYIIGDDFHAEAWQILAIAAPIFPVPMMPAVFLMEVDAHKAG